MYFPDLDLCYYHRGPLDADRWAVPLRAIGWLEHPHPYTTGPVPDALPGKLAELVARTRKTFGLYTFRGLHTCNLCRDERLPRHGAPESCVNLFIPGEGEVYAATGGMLHYIDVHSYCPPASFVRAALACPPPDSPEYLSALRRANKGCDTPLLTEEEHDQQSAIAMHIGFRFIEQLGGRPVPTPRQPLHPYVEKSLRHFNAHVEDPEQARQRAAVARRFCTALGTPLIGAPREEVERAAQSAQTEWIRFRHEHQLVFGPAVIHFDRGTVRDADPNHDWPIS